MMRQILAEKDTTMRIFTYLLYGLFALTLRSSPAAAVEYNQNDPDTWSPAYARYIASHMNWFAGRQPGNFFTIVCDPDFINFSHIRNLEHLASLQEGHRRGNVEWQYTCIQKGSLRLDRPSGQYKAQQPTDAEYDKELDGWFAASYRVVKEDANSQIVEVRYRNHLEEIYDSFFKYEIRDDKIIPMESWVVDKWLVLLIIGVMFISVLFLFVFAVFRLFRFLKSRKASR
jgi:hypothetical protein